MSAAYGWTIKQIQEEFDRCQLIHYYHCLNKRKLREKKYWVVIFGGELKTEEDTRQQMEYAIKKHEDPLFDFPYDVEYFSKEQCLEKIHITEVLGDKRDFKARWDEYRMDACLGKYGIVAKRCSMNNELWYRYNEAKAQGVNLTLATVKKMIQIDMTRSKLYPPGWQDPEKPPPIWYLDKLRKEGKLEKIYQDLDKLIKG